MTTATEQHQHQGRSVRVLLSTRTSALSTEISAIDNACKANLQEREALSRDREEALSELATLRALLAMLDGSFQAVPRDVQPSPDGLGLRIAGLRIAPSPVASLDDLALFAAVMRELYEQATHQTRLANDRIAALKEQAEVPTGMFHAVALEAGGALP